VPVAIDPIKCSKASSAGSICQVSSPLLLRACAMTTAASDAADLVCVLIQTINKIGTRALHLIRNRRSTSTRR
jgi:hypothetical protein